MITPRVAAAVGCAIGIALGPLCSGRTPVAFVRPCETAPRVSSLQMFDLAIAGNETARRTAAVPAGARVLITTTQSGVDVRVEVRDAADVEHSSDTPVRRLGPQRVL